MPNTSRREFLSSIAALTAGVAIRPERAASIRWGYASITWNGNDLQAIDDIASLGFRGIQLRANILQSFGAKPEALRELLAGKSLSLVALSSGAVSLDAAKERQMIDDHVMRARFVRDVGGSYLQVTDEKPAGRAVTSADITRLGTLLTEIGKRTADIGIALGYHNHMNTIGESPADVDRVLDASDAKHVRFELDVAHYFQGGGDSAAAIRRYRDRLLFLHIKDVEKLAGTGYRFVELGRGSVDLKAAKKALDDVNFSGWAVIELDGVPPAAPGNAARTAKECALISKRYAEEQLGLK